MRRPGRTRREFLQGAGLAAAAGIGGLGPARAAEPVTVMTGFGLLPNFIEIMNAYSGGHFARAGLDAKVLGANGTAREMQQIVVGEAQFGRVAALDQMVAIGKQHVPLVAVATICQGSAFQLVSLKDKPVRRAEDLAGKTVGIVSVGGSTDTFLDLILDQVGLAKNAVQRQTTGDNPGALEFVRRGRVDCFLCSLNAVVALERSGASIEYWSTDRYAPMPGQVYLTTAALIRDQPATVLAFLRAMKGSVDELMTQPIAPIFRRAAKDFDIPGLGDLEGAVAVQQATMDRLWLSEGRENLLRNLPARWASGVAAVRQGKIAVIEDPAGLYTNAFVDQLRHA